MGFRRVLIVLTLLALLSAGMIRPSLAQPQVDCGVVNAIDYPLDGISIEHDDFGFFRAGFGGYHAGIDMAFGRYGEPVRATARGRVTFSDTAGWADEKGVVILEHLFPDGSTYFTLYGHMEEVNAYTFPKVGQCVSLGDIIGAVGNPKASAIHLHYEIRQMRASAGGPGYAFGDPLSEGWFHPIEFTEQWRLRLTPAFRNVITSTGTLLGMPLVLPDGNVVFAGTHQIEMMDPGNRSLWRLSVNGLLGVVSLPDGRLLGRTRENQVLLFQGGRFVASWLPDRPLRSPPFLLGGGVAFLSDDHRLISYTAEGGLNWMTDPLSAYLEHVVVSGDLVAISGQRGGVDRLWVIDPTGHFRYEGGAPAPIIPIATPYGFLLLVGTQASLLVPDGTIIGLMDIGQPFGRSAAAALDAGGNLYVYPGQGAYLNAYAADGSLRWTARLAGLPREAPLLGIGAGCVLYALTDSGSLMAFNAEDGSLRGVTTLYAGGAAQVPAARLLEVLPGDMVRFSAGYLSIATVDGFQLAGVESCG
ncbi:MAG TPA: peptidoglycan DD-metalloendopeptidase family protein [Aggregatilineales bacterium]|nr:peptidoglycan DD-metalloendopeptidase family protein [Anaerolineales bacterium]HRE49567.1 peptidoglycan DD-metalloendopeptidase family protein [Aggregatilineales bacterium]